MTGLFRKIVASNPFELFILAMIVLAAVLVGAETYPDVMARHGVTIDILNAIVLWIFVLEALMKMGQHGGRFYRYFLDPWNVFDFLIVAVCFLPVGSSYAAVLRLARLARALRLLTMLPKLQLIVGALLKSIPSMFYVGILLTLNFYVYAVLGVFLFGANDPLHFHDLPTAMLSLFRVVTLEDWTDIMYIQMYGSDVYAYANTTGITPEPRAMPLIAALYFVSFVMFATMVMLNLFIGVVINSMDEAQKEKLEEVAIQFQEDSETGVPHAMETILSIERRLDRLKDDLVILRGHLDEPG